MRRDNGRGRGRTDIRCRRDCDAVYIDAEDPGAREHEQPVYRDPDERAEHECRRVPEPGEYTFSPQFDGCDSPDPQCQLLEGVHVATPRADATVVS